MASLTPGVLSKLLNNAANKDVRVTGGHRSALLQVIEILPSLAGADDDDDGDPWRSRGFFLKVSDSVHSAYVSISDQDLDLVYNDEIQLGQFVYVTRLDSATPVPILRGLKPVPKRRPSPCVGNPIDLVTSDLLPLPGVGTHFGFSKPKSKIPKIGGGKNVVEKGGSERRDSKNNAIVKTKARNSALKSGTLVKTSPGKGMSFEGLELRRLSLDSARKAWDHSPTCNDTSQRTSSRFKSKQVPASVVSDKGASTPRKTSSLKRPNLSISPLKNKNDSLSPLLTKKSSKKELKSLREGPAPIRLVKVPLTNRTWSEQRISWDVLPQTITELGKQAVHHRNAALLAAARSLEEASAAEGVIRCMWIFSEVCESSQKSSAGSLVLKFLDLNQKMQSVATGVDSLLNSSLPGADSSSSCSASTNATSWIKAAIGTNLSTFNLFRKQENDEILNGEKCHYVVLENASAEVNFESPPPASKHSNRNHGTLLSDSIAKGSQSGSGRFSSAARKSTTERDGLSKVSKLNEVASLAQKLLLASREWFLKYLEDSLNIGFGMKREEGSPDVASLLGQLKRVNHWLDNLVMSGACEGGRIDCLRKKLYGFLLEHVDSAVATSQ
ncbi:hypothetical protein PanWU01x14_228840 [Parasponia andersonii]|uniref:Uncharacterized protein n=1 Tax=Parasponia andersonii TaxID=3476 RepID=A0A2P5BLH7_PARAD|nr:hypothetical protein PanWU01x14_228840 [Parasponia andersonii]